MPTYEYICEGCRHEFEQFQSITADPIKTCPICGKEQVRRKISSGAGILFKGGGFYETDYRSEGYKKAAQAEAGGGKADGSKADGVKTDGGSSSSDAPAKTNASNPSAGDGGKSSEAKPAAAANQPTRSEAKAPAVDSKPAAKPAGE